MAAITLGGFISHTVKLKLFDTLCFLKTLDTLQVKHVRFTGVTLRQHHTKETKCCIWRLEGGVLCFPSSKNVAARITGANLNKRIYG